LRHYISGHVVETARFAGLQDLDDGDLLDAMGGRFDVLITGDGSLPYQQVVAGRSVAVVVLKGRGNKLGNVLPLVPALLAVLDEIKAGDVRVVTH